MFFQRFLFKTIYANNWRKWHHLYEVGHLAWTTKMNWKVLWPGLFHSTSFSLFSLQFFEVLFGLQEVVKTLWSGIFKFTSFCTTSNPNTSEVLFLWPLDAFHFNYMHVTPCKTNSFKRKHFPKWNIPFKMSYKVRFPLSTHFLFSLPYSHFFTLQLLPWEALSRETWSISHQPTESIGMYSKRMKRPTHSSLSLSHDFALKWAVSFSICTNLCSILINV